MSIYKKDEKQILNESFKNLLSMRLIGKEEHRGKAIIAVVTTLVVVSIIIGFVVFKKYYQKPNVLSNESSQMVKAITPIATETTINSSNDIQQQKNEIVTQSSNGSGKQFMDVAKSFTVSGPEEAVSMLESIKTAYIMSGKKLEMRLNKNMATEEAIKEISKGTTDIAFIPRNLKDIEKSKENTSNLIAVDGYAIIINPRNSIENISFEDLKNVFSGKISNWDQLGGNGQIQVFFQKAGSKVSNNFENITGLFEIKSGNRLSQVTGKGVSCSDDANVLQEVASNKNAIGVVPLNLPSFEVSTLKINGVEANEENVKNGSYPVARAFNIVFGANVKSEAKDFIEFTKSEQAKKVFESQFNLMFVK